MPTIQTFTEDPAIQSHRQASYTVVICLSLMSYLSWYRQRKSPEDQRFGGFEYLQRLPALFFAKPIDSDCPILPEMSTRT